MKEFSNLPVLLLLFCIISASAFADNKTTNPYSQKIAALQIEQLGIVTKKRLAPDSKIIQAREFAVAEQLAGYACLSKKLGVFGHWGGEAVLENDQCKKELNFLKTHFPTSPLLPCIEHGQESELCKDGSLEQYTLSWKEAINRLNFNQEDDNLPNSYRTEITNNANTQPLWDKVKEIEKQNSEKGEALDKKTQAENERNLLRAYSQLLNASCGDYGLVTYQPSSVIGIATEDFSKSIPDPELAKLNQMVDSFKKAVKKNVQEKSANPFNLVETEQSAPSNRISKGTIRAGAGRLTPSNQSGSFRTAPDYTPPVTDEINKADFKREHEEKDNTVEADEIKKELVRVLILSNNCFEAMEAMLKGTPLHPAPICIREGIFSPQCHGARRRYIIEMSSANSDQENQNAESGVEF